MRFILAIFFLLVQMQPVFSQVPSKNEIQAQMQEAVNELNKQITELEKQIADAKKNKEDPETIKEMEAELVQLKQQLSMIEKAGKNIVSLPSSVIDDASKQVDGENEFKSSVIPAKKTALLNALPKDVLSKTQLTTYLTNLHEELKKKLPERFADVQKIIKVLENDAMQVAYTGVAAWYNNSPAQAALLLTYAATKSSDANTLNNCGAILNLCGLEHKAIPILEHVLVTHPDNSTVLNNLGQAYAGLGDKQKAMMYLMRCMQHSPHHPEACATAAKIEESNGNLNKAMEYTEQALRGAYSEERAEFYEKNKKNCKINVLFDTKLFKKTEYFNPGKLKIPPNCRDWANSETVYPQQQAYFEMIKTISKKYEGIVAANQITEQDLLYMGQESPFNQAALFKKKVLGDCYTERKYELFNKMKEDVRKLIEQQQIAQRKLDEECHQKSLACGTNMQCKDKVSYECCQKRVALDNKYFSLLADISDKYTLNNYTEDVGYYNSLIYLEAVSHTYEKTLAATTAAETVLFLANFHSYILSVNCNPASKPDCEQLNPANQQSNSMDIKDPQCPVGLKLSFGVGEVSLSCKSFGIEAGALVKFGYEKNFITRESTLSMGPSISTDIPGIFEAGASTKAFVKFDANNQPIDVGLSAEASIGIKGTSPIASAGYTMGVNSGFNYSGSSLF